MILPTYALPRSRQRVAHFPQAFERDAVRKLPLPLADERPDSQTIALASQNGFQRERDEDAIQAAYEREPRTRIYEHINRQPTTQNQWYGFVTRQLQRAARHRVLCSVYESNAGDRSIGEHVDKWFGVIVQMRGSKLWTFPSGDAAEQKILTQAGDILLIPQDTLHAVSTPAYSAHIAFAIVTDERLN